MTIVKQWSSVLRTDCDHGVDSWSEAGRSKPEPNNCPGNVLRMLQVTLMFCKSRVTRKY